MPRIDTLRRGQRFRCVSGHTWTFDRKDHALSGAYYADGDHGKRDCFAGCAEVTLLDEPPRCPKCGYSQQDADLHGDHYLCDGAIPTGERE